MVVRKRWVGSGVVREVGGVGGGGGWMAKKFSERTPLTPAW